MVASVISKLNVTSEVEFSAYGQILSVVFILVYYQMSVNVSLNSFTISQSTIVLP